MLCPRGHLQITHYNKRTKPIMDKHFDELKDRKDDARRGLEREVEHLREKEEQIGEYMRALDATDELLAEIDELQQALERKQREIDDLAEQLEQREAEIDALRRQRQAETGDLRQQLLDEKEKSLEAKANAKAKEIHNHFEPGSSAQVLNGKVTGKFIKKKEKKEDKKRWKKMARRML